MKLPPGISPEQAVTLPPEYMITVSLLPWMEKMQEELGMAMELIARNDSRTIQTFVSMLGGVPLCLQTPKLMAILAGGSVQKFTSSRTILLTCKIALRACCERAGADAQMCGAAVEKIMQEQTDADKRATERAHSIKASAAKSASWSENLAMLCRYTNEEYELALVNANLQVLWGLLCLSYGVGQEEAARDREAYAFVDKMNIIPNPAAWCPQPIAGQVIKVQQRELVYKALVLIGGTLDFLDEAKIAEKIGYVQPKDDQADNVPSLLDHVVYIYLVTLDTNSQEAAAQGPRTVRGISESVAMKVGPAPPIAALDKRCYDVNYATRLWSIMFDYKYKRGDYKSV